MKTVHVIGAGLAGSEAAYQLAKRDYRVILHEMRPSTHTEAHATDKFAELVCSNSFKNESLLNAKGLLKAEMRAFDSLILKAAKATRLDAGKALAVDREGFSRYVTDTLTAMENIVVEREEVKEIPDAPTIIATGPLTSSALQTRIENLLGEDSLYFFDAMAPIIAKDSIDMDVCYKKNRWEDDAEGDYINCPMDKDQYQAFYDALKEADTATLRSFETHIFEGCMPVEFMARRGMDTLRFGPLRPVGLRRDPTHKPHAVVQLRQDNAAETLYNLVGFQTRLKYGEQKRLVRMIPGLEHAEIVRYGQMHRNTYLPSPKILNQGFQMKTIPSLFFAGQITGVEGYTESAASGLMAALSMDRHLRGLSVLHFPRETMLGALAYYVSHANPQDFQPMNANLGILPSPEEKMKKDQKREFYKERALNTLKTFKEALDA
ncbi:MAG: methylenetetrahydrofolate--tRNA-(uracil(54)-C(5))-methyltransferase (FADH(2)-oxidizing) TrmFO [Bacillota bacterium]